MGRKEQEAQDTFLLRGGRWGRGLEGWLGLRRAGGVDASGPRVHARPRVNGTEITLPVQLSPEGSSGKEARS